MRVIRSRAHCLTIFRHCGTLQRPAEEYSDERSFCALPPNSGQEQRGNPLFLCHKCSWGQSIVFAIVNKGIQQYTELAAEPGCLSCLQHIDFHRTTLPQGFLAVQTYLSTLVSRLRVIGARRLTANNRRGGVICGWFGMPRRKGVSRLALSCHTPPSVADTT